MKNAGMAGAVALVGIGLITIGLSNFANRADATPAATVNAGPEGDCPTVQLFDSTVRPFNLQCTAAVSWPKVTLVSADVLGEGEPQWIAMPRISFEVVQAELMLLAGSGLVKPSLDLGPLDWKAAGLQVSSEIRGAGWLDVDSDGRLDLVFIGSGPKGAAAGAWLRNIYDGEPRLPADLNDDGRVDGQDLGELFVQWTG